MISAMGRFFLTFSGDSAINPPRGFAFGADIPCFTKLRIEVMFAVVKTGGKQYKVAEGDVIQVEKLPGEANAKLQLGEVLMLCDGDKVTNGSPFVKGASIAAEIVAQKRSDKLIIFKKKRRQNYRRRNNHRQEFTVLKITGISAQEKKHGS
jgi:large subunit ribosomal protein L21